jgi:hypothetical protein
MQTRTVRSLQLGFVFSAALAALAFASIEPASGITTPGGITHIAKKPGGITHIAKNQVWPLKSLITMDPCAQFVCVEL